ncbi:Cap-specific mRNA (nucleoside-2'-O-)-methyltransferase 1 [Balamuthia mandrillaris]
MEQAVADDVFDGEKASSSSSSPSPPSLFTTTKRPRHDTTSVTEVVDQDFPHRHPVTWAPPPAKAPSFRPTGLVVMRNKNRVEEALCDGQLVTRLFQLKQRLREQPQHLFKQARRASNPYERIGCSVFQNRAAVKLANLDHLYGLLETPKVEKEKEKEEQKQKEKFYFGDVCGGPGGFAEYILWRKKRQQREREGEGEGRREHGSGGSKEEEEGEAVGWGFTLKTDDSDCEWHLDKFHPDADIRCFTVNYGADGTGNIYSNENIREFWQVIALGTNERGVDLVTADGGFCFEGFEASQEQEMKQLLLCEVLMMFNILRQGGNFVCKLFDVFTTFTAELLYILYQHFEQFSLIKPFASRPANSERYIVCKGLKQFRPMPVMNYLFSVNERFKHVKSKQTQPSTTKSSEIAPEEEEAFHILPFEQLPSEFVAYVKGSNESIAERQIEALERLIKYCEDPYFPEIDQLDVKERCLREWDIPDEQCSLHFFLRDVIARQRKRIKKTWS